MELRAAGIDPRFEFELENGLGNFEPILEPKFEPRLELTLDAIDKPELYDLRWISLRCTSGVVLADDGVVEVLLGIIDGDLELSRVFIETGGGGGTLMI